MCCIKVNLLISNFIKRVSCAQVSSLKFSNVNPSFYITSRILTIPFVVLLYRRIYQL